MNYAGQINSESASKPEKWLAYKLWKEKVNKVMLTLQKGNAAITKKKKKHIV